MADLTQPTRDVLRSRRKREVRSRTINTIRLPKRDLELGRAQYPEPVEGRPRTRGECASSPRPCPYVSCRFNLYLDVSPTTGNIKLNFPDLEPDELPVSCCLDVADEGGLSLEETGEVLNVTRERIRQLELQALAKIAPKSLEEHAQDHA